MAGFNNQNLSRQTAAMNAGLSAITSPAIGASQIWSYYSATDAVATIEAANYFAQASYELCVNDFIFVVGSDASVLLQVLTVDNTVVPALVTTSTFSTSSTIGTGNITNNAVTYAKIQQASATTLIGNPTGGLANVEEITLGNSLDFSGTTLEVSPTVATSVRVSMAAADWNGMYAAPFQLVAAPGANKMIVVDSIAFNCVYGSAQFAAGGAVAAQYDSTVHGAGPLATGSIAAATINGIAASSVFILEPAALTATLDTAVVNKGLFLSNLSGAFTTGDSAFVVDVRYRVVPTV